MQSTFIFRFMQQKVIWAKSTRSVSLCDDPDWAVFGSVVQHRTGARATPLPVNAVARWVTRPVKKNMQYLQGRTEVTVSDPSLQTKMNADPKISSTVQNVSWGILAQEEARVLLSEHWFHLGRSYSVEYTARKKGATLAP